MKILVANLGSTSFKYRLYDLGDPSEPLLARGAVDRIGAPQSKAIYKSPRGDSESTVPVPDHAAALQMCLDDLSNPSTGVLADPTEVSAVGFKAVHAKGVTGVQIVDDRVLDAMEAYNDVAPAHNPPYVRAMRALREKFPNLPLVAAFETGFHQTIPDYRTRYAIPDEWAALGVRKWGFHGASHRFISQRVAQLVGYEDLRIISCHLGGSSSLCAIKDGKSVSVSMGMSPQSGLPNNNRVGDFDAFGLPVILRETGKSLEDVLAILTCKSGLEAIGGCGNDLRDIEAAAAEGNPKAELAIANFVDAIRHYLGAFLVDLGGADVIAFTGGIGENSKAIRDRVCQGLGWFGIELDPALSAATEPAERVISSAASRVQVWVLPTNEEIVVARQSRDVLKAR
jgi:acetate kinase